MKNFILPFLLTALLVVFFQDLNAQRTLTKHTFTAEKSVHSPKAKITDLSWLVGRWTGSGLGGELEENWNPPLGNSMLGTFQLVENGTPKFYEICLITEENNSLVYKVKHFNPDLTGWEEKDEYVSFRLLKLEPNAAYFDGLTIKRNGKNITQYLAMKSKEGKAQESTFSFQLDGGPEQED